MQLFASQPWQMTKNACKCTRVIFNGDQSNQAT